VNSSACRMSLGLNANAPVLLVMGGSQGAAGINDLILRAVPGLLEKCPSLQILHLSGINEQAKVEAGYAALKVKAVIRPFLTEMELALGAATVSVSRAGASTLAELAAMQLPAVLIPFPTAADNHQYYNAKAFAEAGAALMLNQRETTPEELARKLLELLQDQNLAGEMQAKLASLHRPEAADLIAEKMMSLMQAHGKWRSSSTEKRLRSEENLRHPQVQGA